MVRTDDDLDPQLQKLEAGIRQLTGKVEQLTSLLGGMTMIARTLTANCAKAMQTEESEILEALGRLLRGQHAVDE